MRYLRLHIEKNKPNVNRNVDRIDEMFLKNGYHRYIFGGFEYVYSKEALSDEEIRQREAEAQSIIDYNIDCITRETDKRIIEDMKKQGLITIIKVQDNAEGS